MSSGSTKSVIHQDGQDRQTWVMSCKAARQNNAKRIRISLPVCWSEGLRDRKAKGLVGHEKLLGRRFSLSKPHRRIGYVDTSALKSEDWILWESSAPIKKRSHVASRLRLRFAASSIAMG